MKLLLNTGSTIEQGVLIKGGHKMTDEYRLEVARCHLNSKDFKKIWNAYGSALEKVKVSSEVGSVILFAVLDERVKKGQVFIPRGPWANRVISEYTFDSGSPGYKGMWVDVEATGETVLGCMDLINEIIQRKKPGANEEKNKDK